MEGGGADLTSPPESASSLTVAAARAVVVAYHAAIDRGRATQGLSLFTEDAEFEAKGTILRGRAEIERFLADRETERDRHTVHVITSEAVRRADPNEIDLSAFVLLYVRRPDGEYALDRVLDTVHLLRRTPEGWRVARRSSKPLHRR